MKQTRLIVTGASSGLHVGELVLSDDGKTLVFNPQQPYMSGERVTVRLEQGPKTISGQTLAPVTFSFDVTPTPPEIIRSPGHNALVEFEARNRTIAHAQSPARPRLHDVLPSNYPPVALSYSSEPDSGRIFITPTTNPLGSGGLTMVDNLAMPLFYRRLERSALDFKLQRGLITYHDAARNKFYALDHEYAIVDSFKAANGYFTDFHGLRWLDNGHVLIFATEKLIVAMDSLVAGGNPNAEVTGNIVQIQDLSRNVIFQWRSFDHIGILEADPRVTGNFQNLRFTYTNGNSIEMDHDGHLIFSLRQTHQIIKIDSQTGDVLWRFGRHGTLNDFTFLNDPRGFYLQHDARILDNGNMTVFDNGNYHETQYSRALEYQLDEVNKTAWLVWEYRNTPDVFSRFMANAQRLPSGNTIVGWGGTDLDSVPTIPKVTEVDPTGQKKLELYFDINVWSYRAFKFPWRTTLFDFSQHVIDFGVVFPGDSSSVEVVLRNPSSADIEIDCFVSTDSSFFVTNPVPFILPAGDSVDIEVRFKPLKAFVFDEKIYAWSATDDELVAQDIHVLGSGGTIDVRVPVGTGFALHAARPNPFDRRTIVHFDLPVRSNVSIDVFDVNGRKVETLVDGVRRSGRHESVWDATRHAGGVYFYRMRAGDFIRTRKLVVLR